MGDISTTTWKTLAFLGASTWPVFSFHSSQSLRIHLRQASLNISSKWNYFSAKTLTFIDLMRKIFLFEQDNVLRTFNVPSVKHFLAQIKKLFRIKSIIINVLAKSSSLLNVSFEQKKLEIYYIFNLIFLSADFASSFLCSLLIRVRISRTLFSFKNFSIAEWAKC